MQKKFGKWPVSIMIVSLGIMSMHCAGKKKKPGPPTAAVTTPVTPPTTTPTTTPTPTTPTEQVFGPFGSNENKLLTTLESAGNKYVDFVVDLDTEFHEECAFDFIIIQDAGTAPQRLCNKGTYIAKALQAPVKLTFMSDAQGNSLSVKIKEIRYHNEAPQ